eukprot:jgi/Galph1/4171/GphlegSOOS_G2793.1
METLAQQISELLQSRRYDPDILPELEQYVQAQVKEGTYDGDANLACLKLYQFYPEKTNVTVVTNILLKALAALPSNDFQCCLYLLSEKVQKEESIAKVMTWADGLETGKFMEFWNNYHKNKELVKDKKGFQDAIREFMLGVVSRTFSRIHLSTLQKLLDIPAEGVESFLKQYEWIHWDPNSQFVTFPMTLQPTTIGESLHWKQVLEALSGYGRDK